jgi:beta-galactosidase
MYSIISEVYIGKDWLTRFYRVWNSHNSIRCEQRIFVERRIDKNKGVCLHNDAGALGSAFLKVSGKKINSYERNGANAIRTSHNPPAPEFLDLCDRMGFVVMDEALMNGK